MSFSRMMELIAGLLTASLAVGGKAYILSPLPVSPGDYLRVVSTSTIAAMLVAVGAYAHAVKFRKWGHVLVLLGSCLLTFQLLRLLVVYRWALKLLGPLFGFILIAPGVMASLIAAVSLFNRWSLRQRRT